MAILAQPMTAQRQRMSYGLETAWGTAQATQYAIPVETPDLRIVPGRVVDDHPRGIWAVEKRTYRTVREGQASLGGLYYPYVVAPFIGMFMGTETGSLIDIDGVGGNDLAVHTFTIAAVPDRGTQGAGLTLQLQDEITAFTTTGMRVSGFLVPQLTLSFDRAEGALNWSADMRGGASAVVVDSTVTASAFRTYTGAATDNVSGTPNIIAPGLPFLGFQSSLVVHQNNNAGSDPNAAASVATITTNTAGAMELMSLELNFERALEWAYSGDNSRTPSDFVLGAPRLTFRATVQFRDYNIYKRWLAFDDLTDSTDGPGLATVSGFTGTEQWQLMFSTNGIALPTAATNGLGFINLDTGAATNAFNVTAFESNNQRAALYIEMPEVEYADAEMTMGRGDDLVTVEISGIALPARAEIGHPAAVQNQIVVLKQYDNSKKYHMEPTVDIA